jgi:hypothetical protein
MSKRCVNRLEEEITLDPFASPKIAASYEAWHQMIGCQADRQEKALLKWLLAGFPQARTKLKEGCGTGHFDVLLGKGK